MERTVGYVHGLTPTLTRLALLVFTPSSYLMPSAREQLYCFLFLSFVATILLRARKVQCLVSLVLLAMRQPLLTAAKAEGQRRRRRQQREWAWLVLSACGGQPGNLKAAVDTLWRARGGSEVKEESKAEGQDEGGEVELEGDEDEGEEDEEEEGGVVVKIEVCGVGVGSAVVLVSWMRYNWR